MLSALAKYIFGGVMGDAPETTPMQYETREMNDWLLVDMPDQAIDDEDMDSESDDDEDDILLAVPLLMNEDLANPQQIVLSYEANSVCDNTYGRTRKDFCDKIHSASSKVQVHSGDKIQGNFLKKIETLSVETEDKSQIKVQTTSIKLQENSKSKRSKSKKSKSTKRFRKNKTQDGKDVKIKDMPSAAKENTDNVQEKSSDVPKDFNKAIQSVRSKISDSAVSNNVNKIEDFVVPMQDNSTDLFQDADANLFVNKVQEHFNKTKQEVDNELIHDFSTIKNSSNAITINSEGESAVEFPLNSESRNISTAENIQVQNLQDCNDGTQKVMDDQVIIEGNMLGNSLELKGNSIKSKKLRSKQKRFRKNKIQNSKDVKIIDIFPVVKENPNNVNKNSNDVQKDFNESAQSVECEILDNLVNNNKSCDVNKVEDLLVPVKDNSMVVFHDADAKFIDEKVQEHDEKSKQAIDNEIKSDYSEIKDLSNQTKIMPRREYAAVVKFGLKSRNEPAMNDAQVKNCLPNDEELKSSDDLVTPKGNIQGNSLELKGNFSKSRKMRSKKSRKSRSQYKCYKKIQNKLEVAQGNSSVQENTNDMDSNIPENPSEALSYLDDESNGDCNHEIMDVCVSEDENTEAFLKDIMENFYEFQENVDKKLLFTSSMVQYNDCDVIQDTFLNEKNNSEAVFENSNDVHDLKNKGIGSLENNNHEFTEKCAEVSESTTTISNESQNGSTKNQNNYTEDEVDLDEQFQSKIQDVYSDLSNDNDLEGFSDFWDIYAKFQEDSDDEIVEISDEEMNENFGVEMQASENEMDESSDNETHSATDDDSSDDSDLSEEERELLKLAENWDGKKILQKIWGISPEEMEEESDDNAFPDTVKHKFNLSVNWPVKHLHFNKKVVREARTVYSHEIPARFEYIQCFKPEHPFASQINYYPSNYALGIAQIDPDHLNKCKEESEYLWQQRTASAQKHKKRAAPKKQAPNNATADQSVIINTELQNFINQLKPTVSVLPSKSAVVLEHVKELKPVQQAIQFEARKYLTRSQLNRQNRNYIYQSSVKTNRRRNLQRNHSGANNNRKCY